MRFVQRSDPLPEDFEQRAKDEYDDVVAHRNDPSKTKSFTFKVYKRPEIKQLLQDMFHGKCAYCETFYSAAQPMDVEHYRPKGAASADDSHDGYWWLAMKWDNLLPSCIGCNRKRKQIPPKGRRPTACPDPERCTGFQSIRNRGVGQERQFPSHRNRRTCR